MPIALNCFAASAGEFSAAPRIESIRQDTTGLRPLTESTHLATAISVRLGAHPPGLATATALIASRS